MGAWLIRCPHGSGSHTALTVTWTMCLAVTAQRHGQGRPGPGQRSPRPASRPETVVEFGTSFGISTIYLAAAVTDNGAGRVVTTELSVEKIRTARSNLEQAGVGAAVTIRGRRGDQLLDRPQGPDQLIWGFRVLMTGILQTPSPEEPGTTRHVTR